MLHRAGVIGNRVISEMEVMGHVHFRKLFLSVFRIHGFRSPVVQAFYRRCLISHDGDCAAADPGVDSFRWTSLPAQEPFLTRTN